MLYDECIDCLAVVWASSSTPRMCHMTQCVIFSRKFCFHRSYWGIFNLERWDAHLMIDIERVYLFSVAMQRNCCKKLHLFRWMHDVHCLIESIIIKINEAFYETIQRDRRLLFWMISDQIVLNCIRTSECINIESNLIKCCSFNCIRASLSMCEMTEDQNIWNNIGMRRQHFFQPRTTFHALIIRMQTMKWWAYFFGRNLDSFCHNIRTFPCQPHSLAQVLSWAMADSCIRHAALSLEHINSVPFNMHNLTRSFRCQIDWTRWWRHARVTRGICHIARA